MATIDDFQKLDIRVGKVIEVNDFPEAKKAAYKLKIDFGPEIGVHKRQNPTNREVSSLGLREKGSNLRPIA